MITKDRLSTAVMVAVVWGLAGALFGALFAALYSILWLHGLPGWQVLALATVIAATTTSAFYSAMPVALVGTMAGVVASIGHVISAGHPVALESLVTLAAGAGIAAGVGYGWIIDASGRPLTQTATGLAAGILAGAGLILVFAASGLQVGMPLLVAITVAGVGIAFELIERAVARPGRPSVATPLSAPLVAGLIAAVVGASIWFVGAATATTPGTPPDLGLGQVLRDIPGGLLGGCAGGALTGLLLEIIGLPLEDDLQPP